MREGDPAGVGKQGKWRGAGQREAGRKFVKRGGGKKTEGTGKQRQRMLQGQSEVKLGTNSEDAKLAGA